MRHTNPMPDGPDIAAVHTNEAGAFVNEWSDGNQSPPSASIEDAIAYRQRAKSIALRSTFLRRVTNHG